MRLFLLGAGFNIDATREAGPVYGNSINVGLYRIDCGYPLVADVLKLCFRLDQPPTGKSIEDLFSEASQAGNYEPMEKLVDRLMEADYRIAQKLALPESSNSYQRFFEKFGDAQFLTINYDSLPEIFLAQNGRWYPEDGYGVLVKTELAFGVKLPPNAKSASFVIHLHGSACVYTIESEIVGNPVGGIARLVHCAEPLYAFDPNSISHCFPRYGRVVSPTGHMRIEERVIAPVPDKTEGLKEAFIRQSYAKALSLVRRAGRLIALGYSFNPYDHISYNPVLEALAQSHERTLLLVSPQAGELSKRISAEYPGLRVRPVEKTFRGWAADSFRGL
ncbi:MAG: hypothetical protein ABSF92_00290 [Candidatus Acidiferrales bacterium]